MPHPWETNWIQGKRLGVGGQGVAYTVTSKQQPSLVAALKYLKNNKDPQARRRMQREVLSLRQLAGAGGSVPNVIETNVNEEEDPTTELYFVMDFIPGETLESRVSSQAKLTVDEALACIECVAQTVALAHTFPILHRDLKPDNIILRNDEVAKPVIVDFGLSFNATPDEVTEAGDNLRNRFLALPETNTPNGDLRDPRSDVTAVVALLYYCVTGHVVGQLQDGTGVAPHRRKGLTLQDAISDDARRSSLDAILTRGLTPNIDNRYRNIRELAEKVSELRGVSSAFDLSDPISLAAVMSERLRATDRKTQINLYRSEANKLFKHINTCSKRFEGKLQEFHLSTSMIYYRPNFTLPPEQELVELGVPAICLKTKLHPIEKHRQYLIAAAGSRCIVKAVDYEYAKSPGMGNTVAADATLTDIASYEGNSGTIFELVEQSHKDWITGSISAIIASLTPS